MGLAITYTGRYRWALWLGWALTLIGLALLTLLNASTPTASWIALNLVSGLGLGILWPACSFGAQAAAGTPDLPFAAAMFAFFRVLGQTIGVAIGGPSLPERAAAPIARRAGAGGPRGCAE